LEVNFFHRFIDIGRIKSFLLTDDLNPGKKSTSIILITSFLIGCLLRLTKTTANAIYRLKECINRLFQEAIGEIIPKKQDIANGFLQWPLLLLTFPRA